MKITSAALQHYALPLVKPLTTETLQTTRQGLVLTLYSDAGLRGYGEIAPLPGLHRESLSEVTEQLLNYRSQLCRISVEHESCLFDGCLSGDLPADLYPSVRSGIEMALIDLVLQMNPERCNWPESLPVNALLIPNEGSIVEQVDRLLVQGFSCLKMKMGRQPLEKDVEDVTAVLSTIKGKATLRLDANRKWLLHQARQFCEAIDIQAIEYIEEPTQNPADHIHLIQQAGVPIALDETLSEVPLDALDGARFHAVVLKPSVLGGFEKTAQIIRWARRYHIKPVISSAFQSSLATRMYLIFAAMNGITHVPLGLDTGTWFREDLLSTPCMVEAGRIALTSFTDRPELRPDLLKSIETQC